MIFLSTKPRNGFFMYVLEFQANLKENGHVISNIRQVMDLASPHWNALSDDKKEEYKARAKTSSYNMTFDNQPRKHRKLNCFGQDVDELQANLDIEKETQQKIFAEISGMVNDAFELGELDSTIFYFINVTTFCESLESAFPVELAMAKFSLKEGVVDDLHIQINPGQLPLGSHAVALEKSKKEHHYQLPPNCAGESDFLTVLEKIMKFIHPSNKLPIFFSEGNTRDNRVPLQETLKSFDRICYESLEDQLMKEIKIYPIEELFYELQRVTAINKNRQNPDSPVIRFPSIQYAAYKFRNDDFRYTTEGCLFHEDEGATEHCCLAKVRRFCYTITKWCADGSSYDLREGRHFPKGYNRTN